MNYKILGILGIVFVVVVLIANSFAATSTTNQINVGGWKTVLQNNETPNWTNNGNSFSFSTLEKIPYTDLNIILDKCT